MERWGNMVCGSVVLEAERGMRIKMGRGSVVDSGGLMLMETMTSPRVGSSPDPGGGRGVRQRTSGGRVVRVDWRCC